MEKPKKKSKKALWITLIVIFSIIIIPIGTVFILFYDNGRSTTIKDENFKVETTFYNAGVDSLDNTKDTGIINFNINEHTFNQLLLSAFEDGIKQDKALSQFIKGLSIKFSSEHATINFDIDLYGFFKTRAYIILKISEGKRLNDLNQEEEALILKISDIKLGRVGGLYDLVKMFLPQIFSDTFIHNLLGATLPIHSNIDKKEIYIFKSEMVSNIIETYSGNGLLVSLFEEFFSSDLFTTFSFDEDGLTADIDISSFQENKDFIDKSKAHQIDWLNFKEQTEDLIEQGLISKEKASNFYEYLVKGYDRVDTPIRDFISTLDLSSIDIDNLTSYQGVFTTTNEKGKIQINDQDLLEIALDNLNDISTIASTKNVLSFSEDDLNAIIQSSNIIGESYILDRYELKNDVVSLAKVNPIVITDIYCNILSSGLKFVIVASINGYETNICLHAKYTTFDPTSYTLEFVLEDSIYFGNSKANDSLQSSIFSILKSELVSDDAITYKEEGKKMYISFAKAIQDSGIKADIELVGTPTCILTGILLSDEGTLDINLE